MQLRDRSKEKILIPNLIKAEGYWSRMKGLLGKKSLEDNEGLWIPYCNSIHTLFMSFPIDCVFLSKRMYVVSIKENVFPWKIILPQWGATSVIELTAGSAKRLNISAGDELYVGA